MVVYVLVILVLIVLLVASFRALSGGESLTESDYHTVLVSLVRFTDARRDELDAVLSGPRGSGDGRDRAVDVATGARKKLAGYQQQLARFGGTADHLEAARTLLSAAIEDLGWACRMVEPGTYWDNPGVREAVTSLRRHGGRSLDQARVMLAVPGSSEP